MGNWDQIKKIPVTGGWGFKFSSKPQASTEWEAGIRSRVTKRHPICKTKCNNHALSQGANRKASYLRRAVVAPRVTQEKEETLQPSTKGTGF